MPEERLQGTVKFFSEQKGYGFITRPNEPDVFVHYTEIQGQEGYRKLEEDQIVEFELGESQKHPEKGPIAKNVIVLQ